MDRKKLRSYDDPEAIPGVIIKSGSIKLLTVTDDDLAKINQYTLDPVSAEDVFVFKACIADNEQDDRNFMPFNLKALQDLKELYPGVTMLKDHHRLADNQIARVYDTELISDSSKTTELGEIHTELIAKIYMIRTEANKDLITEISGGIKREVSTSTVPEKMECSICGVDNMKNYCRHYPGVEYDVRDADGKSTKRRCKMLLHGAKEAYELSFVAVPAQPRAGTTKSIGFVKPVAEPIDEIVEELDTTDKTDARLVSQRLDIVASFLHTTLNN